MREFPKGGIVPDGEVNISCGDGGTSGGDVGGNETLLSDLVRFEKNAARGTYFRFESAHAPLLAGPDRRADTLDGGCDMSKSGVGEKLVVGKP